MAKIVGIDLGTTRRKKLFINKFESSSFKQSFQVSLMRRFFGSKFNSHNISNNSQSNSNDKQSIANLSAIEYLVKLLSIHDDNQSNIIAVTMLTILKIIAFVNSAWSRLINPGPIKIKANQPAERLPLMPESTLKNDFLTAFTLAKMGSDYNNSKLEVYNWIPAFVGVTKEEN